jgi:hypothetical protein
MKNCAIILKDFKRELSENDAAKVSQIGCLTQGGNSYGIFTKNMERKAISTDKHAILLGKNFLEGNYTLAELKAILAHEVSHITLGHLTQSDSAFRLLNDASRLTFLTSASFVFRASILSLFSAQKNLPSMFILCASSAVIAKIFSIYSQNLELQADKESIRLSNDPDSLISCIKKMEDAYKAEYPYKYFINTLFSSHPDVTTRQKALKINQMTEKEEEHIILHHSPN